MTGIIVGWIVVGIASGLIIWLLVRSTRRARVLIKTGVPLEATIVKVLNEGTVVSGSPGVMFRVIIEVTPPAGAPFNAEKDLYVSLADAGSVRPGGKVKIVMDPKTNRVAIPGTDDRL
ncbi:MAG TPA: hypothetical protein VLX68_09400 [Chitinivibrionales bacterium]|nr:hypothetical protein [Chitinivibrionales bacterium]